MRINQGAINFLQVIAIVVMTMAMLMMPEAETLQLASPICHYSSALKSPTEL